MEQMGLLHLYYGDGKGKTTAAMGLALRMAGRGRPVVIAQFLKGADSGERPALARLPQVTLLPVPERVKFLFAMTEEERPGGQTGPGTACPGQAGRRRPKLRPGGAGRGVRRGERRAAPSGRAALPAGLC